MAIGKRKTTGESLGQWKWDFDLGKSVFEDRVYANKGWETQQRNVENGKFRAVFDMENIEVGWLAYMKGEGLVTKLVPLGQDYGDRPSDKHNEGLRLLIKTDPALGGEVRELVTTSAVLWTAIDELHDKFLAHTAEHPGCLPAVDIAGTCTGRRSLLGPIFKIAGWMPRPPELPAAGIPLVMRAKKGTFERPAVRDELSDEIPF
jgi:hypothetical protein